MRKQLLAVSAALAIALSLSACGGSNESASGDASASGTTVQTAAEACVLVEEEMSAFAEKYSELSDYMGSSSDEYATLVADINAEFAAVTTAVTNEEVGEVWQNFVTSFNAMLSAAESEDLDAVTEATTGLIESASAFETVCPTDSE